ncbi:MAG TPA: hypothetical protein VHV82_02020 [Sporichthyaceae bacterium]|jgi:hypothetical protein|nr:hypothetical protein [Sporichthyaceae bacterium]
MTMAPLPAAEVGSILRARLESFAQEVCAAAGPVERAGLAVRLRIPAHRAGPGVAPICDDVEVFADHLASQCEQLQTRLRQGPRVLAAAQRASVLVADLDREQRWPVFRTTAATRHGLAAVQVEPLIRRGGPVLGTLAWYTGRAAAFPHRSGTDLRRAYTATVTAALIAVHRTTDPAH